MSKQITKWNDPEFSDVIRLIHKFFPESKTFIQHDTGISIYQMIDSMRLADFYCDYSCEHFGIPEGPDLGLNKKGGFTGANNQVLERLLEHTSFKPNGRAVIIADALGMGGWAEGDFKPFICATKSLTTRLNELEDFFEESSQDRILVFETGEAICIDHDMRFF